MWVPQVLWRCILLADELPVESLDPGGLPKGFWEHLWGGFIGTVIFGLLGIALAVLGFKVFDWITPRIDIQRELSEHKNIAVAIVVAAIVLGICHIVAVAVK